MGQGDGQVTASGVIFRRVDGGFEIRPRRSSGGRCLPAQLFGQPMSMRQSVGQLPLFAERRQRSGKLETSLLLIDARLVVRLALERK